MKKSERVEKREEMERRGGEKRWREENRRSEGE